MWSSFSKTDAQSVDAFQVPYFKDKLTFSRKGFKSLAAEFSDPLRNDVVIKANENT